MKTMKKSSNPIYGLSVLLILLFFSVSASVFGKSPKQQYYEIRIYHVKQSVQSERMDSYLKNAFIPAMHRAGISKVGVFKPVEADTAFGKLIYVFVPLKNVDQYLKLAGQLSKDKDYQKAGKEFYDAAYNDPPFIRYESILLKAFAYMPQFRPPVFDTPAGDRIYELRSYESATEAKAAKKIEMFNEGGEMTLFESMEFNAAFYGEVIVGSHKPNLMYMTTFKDMATRDEKWKAFGSSPEWKKISGLEIYKNTVSRVSAYLLHPASYSDF
jgi:hypothetical protein